MKRTLELVRKMRIAFGAVLVVLLAVGVVSYRSLVASAETEQWVQHTHEVLEHLESFSSIIGGTETRNRGLALSGQEAFPQPSPTDVSLAEQEEKKLYALTADNPSQQRRLGILAGLAHQIIRDGDALVRLRQTGGPEAAAMVLRQGRSERNLDEFRAAVRDMEDEERVLLLARNADAQRRILQAKGAIFLGSILGLLITFVAGWIVRRDYDVLGHAEAKYRGLLEAAPDAIVVVNQRGEIPLVNLQAEKQFGYPRDELLGQPVTNIIPEGFAERLIADGTRTAAEALEQQIGTGLELSGRRKDGSEFPIEIMLSPLESAEGTLVTAAIRDISVRKSAEKHLEQMEGRYRALLEAAPDAMVVVNQGGEIVLLNLQAEKQFGYQRDELLGQHVTNIIPEGFAERLIADGTRTAAEALEQQIGTGLELSGRRKDGSEFPIEIMLSPLESAEGTLVTAAIRDISVRKSAEKHLEEMEGRYRALLEAAPDAMVVVNQGGEIVLLNLQAEKQFGYRRDELLGQHVTNIIPEGFAERLIADGTRTAAEALAQQIGTGLELSGRRKDGSEFPIEIMLSPLESAEGILVTAAIRNVSAARAMSRQMAHSAQHDFLTGLPNRMLVNDRVSQAIAFAQRHKKRSP